jgi:hypothetical protein
MSGVFPNETSIYIVSKNTNGSALTDAGKIVGEITNWAKSGGEQEIESIPVIGGFVDKENPRSQIEVSFDVIVNNAASSTLDRYDIFYMGRTGSITGNAGEYAIFIHHATGSNHKTIAFNNARTITWDPEMAADDMLKGTITFKLSPETPLGVSNLKTSALHPSVAFFNWA